MTNRTLFMLERLRAELGQLDGGGEVRAVTELQWVGLAMPVIDQVCGWTSPVVSPGPPSPSVLFRVCMANMYATTQWLEDPRGDGRRFVYTTGTSTLIPSIDNYICAVTDLLIGETIATLRHPLNERRAQAEADLRDRHPQALRLLTAVQVRALDKRPT